MNEDTFWKMIDDAWTEVSTELASTRQSLATEENPETRENLASKVEPEMDSMVDVLRERLNDLSVDDLLAFDRILERKLYEIDREDVQEHTDGSDDGFLYCRGFIVGAGRSYYEAVNKDPTRAVFDMECEALTYLSFHLIHEKFGEDAWTPSAISREDGQPFVSRTVTVTVPTPFTGREVTVGFVDQPLEWKTLGCRIPAAIPRIRIGRRPPTTVPI